MVMASELRYVSISLHLVSGDVSDVLVHIPDVHPLKSGVTLSGAVPKERNVDSAVRAAVFTPFTRGPS